MLIEKKYIFNNVDILNENITMIKLNYEYKKIIIVYENINNNHNNIKISNETICPECNKNIFIEIDAYEIK